MDRITLKLTEVFEREFPGHQLIRDEMGTRIGGILLWDGFAELDQVERQDLVRAAIRDNFDLSEQKRVGLIVTLTPHEHEIIKAESA